MVSKKRISLKKVSIHEDIDLFRREFKRRLFDFVTGAFAFVAALLWRDAINKLVQSYVETVKTGILITNPWIADFVVAFAVTVLAVVAIVLLSKTLKVE